MAHFFFTAIFLNMAHFFFTAILLHCFAFLGLAVGAAGDHHILYPNHTLAVGHTLVSQNQVFEMGFFSPGKSLNRFLGVWYRSTPEVVVWVANRNNPITPSQSKGVVFMISGNGSLVISRGNIIIWTMRSLVGASKPVLQLMNTGNLVLVDEETEIWQSFDYPTDTLLPGMKLVDDIDAGLRRNLTSWTSPDDPSPGDYVHGIEDRGLTDSVTMRGTMKVHRLGQWNGIHFCGGPRFPNEVFTLDIVFKEEKLISVGEPYEESILKRVTLETSGSLQRYTMNAKKDKWNLADSFPRDMCDEYGACGPNSICRSKTDNGIVRCQCLKGFSPKFQKDWDLQDWSGGCTRTKPLNCEGGDGFLEVRGLKYPDMLRFRLNRSMSLGECKDECLRNCRCTAYANPFITNGGTGCSIWFSDLIDIKELYEPDKKQNIYIRVLLSESVIKMAAIVQATNNFSRENLIGAGGFGPCISRGTCHQEKKLQ